MNAHSPDTQDGECVDPSLLRSVRNISPDRVADIAYCYYVSGNAALDGTEVCGLSHRVVQEYDRLSASVPPCTKEHDYLFTISQIIVSLSRGIGRRKGTLHDKLAFAEQQKEELIHTIVESTRQSGFLYAVFRALLLGGFGFFIAKALLPDLHLGEDQRPNYMAPAMAVALVLLGSYMRAWLIELRIVHIFNCYRSDVNAAYAEYHRGALEEYRRAERDARAAWKALAGEEAADWPGFDEIIEEEMTLRDDYERQRQEIVIDPLVRTLSTLGQKVRSPFGRRKTPAP